VRRPFAVRPARHAVRTLVSAGLLTAAGRASSNQIGDNAFPWLRFTAFRNAQPEADKEHEGCPTALPGPVRWVALVFTTSEFAVGIATRRDQQAPAVAGRQVCGSPWDLRRLPTPPTGPAALRNVRASAGYTTAAMACSGPPSCTPYRA
jgi:hypothetical protein